jgi:hypothetical protein
MSIEYVVVYCICVCLVVVIICGITWLVIAKRNKKKSRWPVLLIVFPGIALISAVSHYFLFS